MKRPSKIRLPFLTLTLIAGFQSVAPLAHAISEGRLTCSAIFSPAQEPSNVVPFAINERVIDQIDATVAMERNRAEREELSLKQSKNDDLRRRIKALRDRNGLIEIPEVTERRMSALTLEVLALLDDMDGIRHHFEATVRPMLRTAIAIQVAEKMIQYYDHQMKHGNVVTERVKELKKAEETALRLAKVQFIENFDAIFPAFVALEGMRAGALIDVTKLFGGENWIADARGALARLRSENASPVQTVSAAAQASAPAVTTESLSLPEMVSDRVTVSSPNQKPEVIRQRAEKIADIYRSYYQESSIQQMIAKAQADLGAGTVFEMPKFEDLIELRKSSGPNESDIDYQNEVLRRTYKSEKWLAFKLTYLKPHQLEALAVWVESQGRFRKAFTPLVRLSGLEYNQIMRKRHLGKVLKIMSMKNPKDQVAALWGNNGATISSDAGELILTFFRFTLTPDHTNAIMTYLRKSTDPWEEGVRPQFQKYFEESIQRGALPVIDQKPNPGGALALTAIGSAATVAAAKLSTIGVDDVWIKLQEVGSSQTVHQLIETLKHLAPAIGGN